MAIGNINDVINAKSVTLVLDPNGQSETFITLQEISLPLSRPETREEVSLGSVYFYGQHDNAFEAVFLLTATDLATWLDNNAFTNGALVPSEYNIIVVGKTGVTKTLNVFAVTPHQIIDKPPTGGVKINQYFRITHDVSGADVS